MTLSPFWLSLQTAFVATALSFCGGIALANSVFRYRGRARGLIDGLLTLPIVLPPTAVGFLLLLLLGRSGPVGQLLQLLGIQIIFSWPATVVAATVVALPLMYKTVLGAFEQIDPDLLSCARTLGASEYRVFWQLMLPLAQPGIIAGTILAFARALGEFGATLMLAGSIPGRTETMPIAIFLAVESGEIKQALVWVGVMVAIALLSITALNIGADPQQSRPVSHPKRKRLTAISVQKIFEKYVSLFCIGPLNPSSWGSLITTLSAREKTQLPLRLQAIKENGTQRSTMQASSQSVIDRTSLTAVVHKDLPGFSLNVSLAATDKPLGILGASGSGKSMTLRCIAGLETPDRGRIVLNDRVLFDSDQDINIPTAQRRIGVMWQHYALFPHMTVAQNIGFGLEVVDREQVGKFLSLMQLEGLAHHYPHQLSGGQQQRVALARALAPQPEALLLDEPISALDSGLRSQLEDLLIQTIAAYPCPTLFVTHNLGEAYRICDHLLVLAEGDAIASGSNADICERPETIGVAKIMDCQNFSRIEQIDDSHIQAEDWNCTLQILPPIPEACRYVGIYAHNLRFVTEANSQENIFACWLAKYIAMPHRITLYLKVHIPAKDHQDHQLQVDLLPTQWTKLKEQPFPWFILIDPCQLILMRA